MSIDWSIIAASAGFAGAGAVLQEYRLWRARRLTIPLDWNPRSRTFEPDFKLKRMERRARLAIWAIAAAHLFIAYNVVVNDWFVHWP